MSAARNGSRSSASSSTSVSAVTVAVRGTSRSSAISPKQSPASSTRRRTRAGHLDLAGGDHVEAVAGVALADDVGARGRVDGPAWRATSSSRATGSGANMASPRSSAYSRSGTGVRASRTAIARQRASTRPAAPRRRQQRRPQAGRGHQRRRQQRAEPGGQPVGPLDHAERPRQHGVRGQPLHERQPRHLHIA